MNTTRMHLLLLAGVAIALTAVPCGARAQLSNLPAAAPLTMTHVTDRLLQLEKKPYRMFALSTPKGIVIIDTQPSAELTREAVAMARKEFKQTDIAIVVNSHEHIDHIAGDAAFPGVPIVAADGIVEGIRITEPQIPGYAANAEKVMATARAQRDSMKKGSPAYDSAAAKIAFAEVVIAAGKQPIVRPTITFNDRLTLGFGDRSVRLVSMGRRHSYGDMLVYLPEEHVLLTAATVDPREYIPYIAVTPRPADVQRWVAVLTEFSDTSLHLTHIVTGHRAELKQTDLVFARDYWDRLWRGLAAARAQGSTLEQARQQLSLDTGLRDLLAPGAVPQASRDTHAKNVDALWKLLDSTATAEKAAPTR